MGRVTTLSVESFVRLMCDEDFPRGAHEVFVRWFKRGDGAAVYRNLDLCSAGLGRVKIVSFGSPAAQLETDEPPVTLPDIGNAKPIRGAQTATPPERASAPTRPPRRV